MKDLASTEHDGDLDLVTLFEEFGHLPGFRIEVAGSDLRSVLHLLDTDMDGLALGLLGPLRGIELELAVVHDATDRRISQRCHFNQVKVELAGKIHCINKRFDTKLFTVGVDQADLAGADSVVDPGLIGGDGSCYSTSLPIFGPRTSRNQRIRSGAATGTTPAKADFRTH